MRKIANQVKAYAFVVLAPILFIIVLFILSPQSRSWTNVLALLGQSIAPAILGWGVQFDIKVGNWDFAVGSEVLMASIIGGNVALMFNLGVSGLIICCVVIGGGCGALVGIVYRLMKIPTLIVSIGILLIYESLCSILFSGRGVSLDRRYIVMGNFPMNIIAFLACFLIAYVLYYRRRFGFNIRAVGSNAVVAQNNGISIMKTKTLALVTAGLFAGLYAAVNLGSAGTVSTVGSMETMSVCFDAMMCVFVGMAICGRGNIIFAIYCGSLIMQVIKAILMVVGLPSNYNKIVIAVFVLLFMVLSSRSDLISSLWKKIKGVKRTREGLGEV